MNKSETDSKKLENVIEVDEHGLSIHTIECIANNNKIKQSFEKKHKENLYTTRGC